MRRKPASPPNGPDTQAESNTGGQWGGRFQLAADLIRRFFPTTLLRQSWEQGAVEDAARHFLYRDVIIAVAVEDLVAR